MNTLVIDDAIARHRELARAAARPERLVAHELRYLPRRRRLRPWTGRSR